MLGLTLVGVEERVEEIRGREPSRAENSRRTLRTASREQERTDAEAEGRTAVEYREFRAEVQAAIEAALRDVKVAACESLVEFLHVE